MLQIMLENVTFKPRGQGHFQKKKNQTQNKNPMNSINTMLKKQCFDFSLFYMYMLCFSLGFFLGGGGSEGVKGFFSLNNFDWFIFTYFNCYFYF